MSKVCPFCKIEKPLADFGFKSEHAKSRQSSCTPRAYCKKCKSTLDAALMKLMRITFKEFQKCYTLRDYSLCKGKYFKTKMEILQRYG